MTAMRKIVQNRDGWCVRAETGGRRRWPAGWRVAWLAGGVLLLGGCASFEPYSMHHTTSLDFNETYLDIINREAKLKARRFPQRRMILFYGKASETEQRAGVLFKFPF